MFLVSVDFDNLEQFLGRLNGSLAQLVVVIRIGLTAIPIPLVHLTKSQAKGLRKLLHLLLRPE